jgi:predicted permease
MMRGFLRDLRLAVRTLLRQPGHTALVVSILALGLGATTATFSLVNTALLRPLPFPEPDGLVHLQVTVGPEDTGYEFLPPWVFRHLREHNDVFEGMAAVALDDEGLAVPGQPPESAWSLWVTADFFPLLGVRPALGRTFLPEEAEPGRDRVVVLSDRLWRARFAGDPNIVGRSLQQGEETVTVVGVMPPSFNDPLHRWTRAELWRPMALSPAAMDRGSHESLVVWARLKPGVTKAAARARLDALIAHLDDGKRRQTQMKRLSRRSGLNEEIQVAAGLALGLAVFVLMIACTNLASVQLARMAGRGHEQAIRVALGASRGRLVRAALAESLLVSLAGGALGLLLASWGAELVAGRLILDEGRQLTVGLPVELDAKVLTFALAGALASALIVGTAPAWLSARAALFDTLRKGGHGTTDRAPPRLRQALVVAQMAMALMLLMGGGLFLRGLQRMDQGDQGWRVDGLLIARVRLRGDRYDQRPARFAFVDRLRDRLASVPGVTGSAVADWVPVQGHHLLRFAADKPEALQMRGSYLDAVSPDYFRVLGMTLREGRLFGDADALEGQPVAIVNERMARELWPGQSALGKRLSFAIDDPGASPSFRAWKTIVGVVADVQFPAQLEDARSRYQAYYPFRQAGGRALALAVRTAGHPEAVTGAVRAALAELDPGLVLEEASTARALIERERANFTVMAWLMFAFAALGILLSSLGVYGLFSGYVAERTREIGVRMALGARGEQVLALVLQKGLRLAALGALVGMLGTAAIVPALRAVAYELPPHEPLAVVVLALVLVAVALFACWLPARRAAALDPMVALRQE